MILLSLNLRGTGGTLKLTSVRSVLEKTCPEIVLFRKLWYMQIRLRPLSILFDRLGLVVLLNHLEIQAA